ncbi:hypothetical protein A2V56_03580 [Candidatus Woesebacteria bacterium RBG_19FT_COMBO_42_9]|uniref:Transposase IS200-like domain-containing protein n=1 Tax=Candidatus Woesebacteria bacterium RBG_16_42_24 TaxID=1802485 RepID=A0A1F7XKG3_9BACT|nr:MAG: hypothetical protein A2V97_00660 [Candidatus Woesebacteria bacterium RBG_16_42_24]OGM16134.1 MAG: hypothetical protein A2V56_03580 [Candidatus Woesebacteria bacterium RBG_19FT_COMBO_42_9]OGM67838.1 MAG: hypothetical protein A2985_00185 [Candidatus Woesebacteria bacterium RIFCSPLOWO2_01_FULL_43_11]
MPRRKIVLATNEYYHIFNRGSNKKIIFNDAREYSRFFLTARYYSIKDPPLKFSRFVKLGKVERRGFWEGYETYEKLVSFNCFCFMPNHYHFLLKQESENGISQFIKKLQTSYSHYSNIKHENEGPLWTGQFKAVRVENENQLFHLSRYIHLNSVTSYLTHPNKLESYIWSSYREYLGKSEFPFCSTKEVLSNFKSVTKFKEFVSNQIDYQRRLKLIKNLTFD